MGETLEDMKSQAELLKESREREFALLKGKSTIESDQDDYRPMLAEKDRFDALFGDFKGKAESYNRESGAFSALAEKYSIASVVTADLEKAVQDYRTDSDRQISLARAELERGSRQLEEAARGESDKDRIGEKRTILAEMDAIIKDIEGNRDEILNLAEQFRAEAGESGEYFVEPGMSSYTLLTSIRGKSEEIASLANRMNELSGQFAD